MMPSRLPSTPSDSTLSNSAAATPAQQTPSSRKRVREANAPNGDAHVQAHTNQTVHHPNARNSRPAMQYDLSPENASVASAGAQHNDMLVRNALDDDLDDVVDHLEDDDDDEDVDDFVHLDVHSTSSLQQNQGLPLMSFSRHVHRSTGMFVPFYNHFGGADFDDEYV